MFNTRLLIMKGLRKPNGDEASALKHHEMAQPQHGANQPFLSGSFREPRAAGSGSSWQNQK
jgi:hypothetical protein